MSMRKLKNSVKPKWRTTEGIDNCKSGVDEAIHKNDAFRRMLPFNNKHPKFVSTIGLNSINKDSKIPRILHNLPYQPVDLTEAVCR